MQAGTNRSWGDVLGDTVDRVGDLLTLDFLVDRGLVGQQQPERQLQTTTTDDPLAGPRGGVNPAYVWGGGIAIAALLALYLVFRK